MAPIAFQSEMTPLLIAHIAGGGIGVIAGAVALFTRKGAPAHRAAGTVFAVAMLIGAASAAWLAYAGSEPGLIIAGVLSIYLIATGYMTVKRRDGQIGVFERGAFLLAATGAAAGFYLTYDSVRTGNAFMDGVPGYIFASVVALAALFDLSVILRRGVSGRRRIARHLWRMHVGFFIAAGSFFPGQLHLFPEAIREIRPLILLFIPPFLIVGLMVFWLVRVQLTSWFRVEPRLEGPQA